ncbi:MAG: hypothetical protein E6J62_02405 [Deltaproteobacteria bacterium]|nr:MAG: hypothetical protein E6J62_02405 [Deltaproteobacteria bacterium]
MRGHLVRTSEPVLHHQTHHDAGIAGQPTCLIDTTGHVVGHYEFDIGATGYKTQHLTADVAASPPSGGCCPVPASYVPVTLRVALSP